LFVSVSTQSISTTFPSGQRIRLLTIKKRFILNVISERQNNLEIYGRIGLLLIFYKKIPISSVKKGAFRFPANW